MLSGGLQSGAVALKRLGRMEGIPHGPIGLLDPYKVFNRTLQTLIVLIARYPKISELAM